MIAKKFLGKCRTAVLAAMCLLTFVSCGHNEDAGDFSGTPENSSSASESGSSAEEDDNLKDLDISEIPDGAAYKCTESMVCFGNESITQISYCDDKDNEIRIIFFPDSELMSVVDCKNEYDSQGRLVRTIDKDDFTEFEYYDNGEISNMSIYQGNELLSEVRFIYEYDSRGRPVTVEEYWNGSDELFSITNRTYDENGNMTEENIMLKKFDMESNYTYEYDEKGRMIKKVVDSDSYYVYEYEDYNRPVK